MSESSPREVTVTLHLYTAASEDELMQELMSRLYITAGEIGRIEIG